MGEKKKKNRQRMRLQMKPWALLTRLQEPGETDTLMLHDRWSLYML